MEEKQHTDTHGHCYHEQDWGQIKAKVNGVCSALVSQRNDIKGIEADLTFQLKDLRTSNKIDFQKAEEAAKNSFVTKAEFLASNRAVYLAVTLIILEAVKRYLT